MRAINRQVLSLLFLAASFAAAADPGQPDPSFGLNGIAALDFGRASSAKIMATARQSDGRIIVAGRTLTLQGTPKLAVGRLNADGTQDTTFGTNGWTVLQGDLSYNDTTPIAATVMAGDGIAVAGVRDSYPYLAILSANGAVSSNTPPDGFRMDYQGFAEQPWAIAYLPNGYLVVAGAFTLDQAHDAYVTVYTTEGFRYPYIGNNGRFQYSLSAGQSEARAIMVQPDASFYLAGFADNAGNRDFAVARVNSNYQLNTAFGTNGVKTLDFGGQDIALAMAQENLGHFIVAGGSALSSTSSRFALARMSTTTGDIDLNYGNLGLQTVAVSASYGSYAQIVSVQSLGFFQGVIVAGNVTHDDGLFPIDRGMVVARYDGAGQPYAGFGTNGAVFTTPSQQVGDTGLSIHRVGEDRLMAVGSRGFATNYTTLVSRHAMDTGAPDSTFGPGGVAEYSAYVPSEDYVDSIVRLPDGRFMGTTYSASDAALFRVNADGSWDQAFGLGGAQPMPREVHGPLAVQPDGKLVIGHTVEMPCGGPNTTCQVVHVSRFNADGSVDFSFNGNGRVMVDFGPVGQYTAAIAVLPDGRIVVAASVPYQPAAYATRFGIAQLSPGGAIIYQRVIDRPGTGAESPTAIALLDDGGMFVSGAGDGGQVIYRLTSNGSLVSSWGNAGVASVGCSVNSRAGIALASDGKVTLGGVSSGSSCFGRLTAAGALDPSFGIGGMQTHSFSFSGYEVVTGVAFQPDGRLVASILTTYGSGIARLNSDGSRDGTFNTSGFTSIPFHFYPWGVFLQPDGSPVLWGEGAPSGDSDAIIARFQGGGAAMDTTPDPFFFNDASGVATSTVVTSNAVTITGINAPAQVSVVGGMYSINCWPTFDANPGTVTNGQTICVRHTSSATGGGTVDTILTVGGVSDTFTSTTAAFVDTFITAMPSNPSGGSNLFFSFNSSNAAATIRFECALNAQAFATCSSPKQVFPTAAGSNTFQVRAVSAAGPDPTPASYTWVVDVTEPDTTITSQPPEFSASTSATFTFTSNDPGAHFECKLDNDFFNTCTSPKTYNGLIQGGHIFQVRAVDAVGNTDFFPAKVIWTVDTQAPDTTITSGPPQRVASTTATFTFTVNDSTAIVECRVDNTPYSPCTSPVTYTGVAEGNRQFVVRARDIAGNIDPTPSVWFWSVDSIAPDTTITTRPPAISTSTSATFFATSNETFFTLQCSLDGAPFTACNGSITYTGLSQGDHLYAVRAIDPTGNVDATPATASWTVDTVAPETTIVSGPSGTVASTSATFAFTANEGATFECRLDGAAFTACTSPVSYNGLAQGAHTFNVRARDAAGFLDATPASRAWSVDTVASETTITSGPASLSSSTSATFTVTVSESGATLECSLDGSSFAACTSPVTYTGLAQGNHSFAVRSVDAVGNADATPATASWTVDSVAPETTIVSGPSGNMAATSTTLTFSANETATFECRLDGAAFASCSSPVAYTGLADGAHSFEVRATDGIGNVDATPAAANWTVDGTPPETVITSAPSEWTSVQTSVFTFTSNDPGAVFECQIDGQAFAACTSPATYPGLAEGTHLFRVRAVDAVGNVDPTPDEHDWIIDLTSPDTLITSGPDSQWPSSSVTVTFQASEPNSTFQCALDGFDYAACTSPATFSGIADGTHRLLVRSIDAAGNVDASPSVIVFNVDTVAPDTTITSGPEGSVSSATATFAFETSELFGTFECRLDGGAFAACTSPANYSGLAQGPHSFEVRTTDGAGNVDATPAVRAWTIDTAAPDTAITAAPPSLSATGSASFSFTSTESPSSFECRIDGGAWSVCASPQSYSSLADGSHTFDVRAKDAAGNFDATPASHTWTIDSTAPDTSITSGPSGTVASSSATFVFTSNEAGATFECRLDGAAFAACTSPATYSGLGQGSHTFDVRAKDGAGNLDATPASRAWSVDTVAPDTSITSGPSGTVGSTSATFAFTASEGGASFECRLDGAAFAACSTPASYTGLGQGSHAFEVRAKDALGNTDASPASRTWTVDTAGPDTTITSGPSGAVASTSATFTFTASEGGSTFECRRDGAAFATCTSPVSYSSLTQGSHTFDVRARDALGNLDASPASRTWTVDTVTPITTITSGPPSSTSSTTATFTFTSSEAGTFECKLDAAAFLPCTAPKTYTGLSHTNHTFQVRAKDAAGNLDPSPASDTWRVR